MAGVRFYDESPGEQSAKLRQKSPLVRLILAAGIVSTESQAEYALLGIAILIAALAIWILSFVFGGSQIVDPPPMPPGVVISGTLVR